MRIRCYLVAYLDQMDFHRLAVAMGHDDASPLALGGADSAEYPCGGPPHIAGRDWSGSSFCPAAREFGLLADPSLVLPPQLYGCAFGEGFADLRQTVGELFLKTVISSGRCA